jgi:hypothetical protein
MLQRNGVDVLRGVIKQKQIALCKLQNFNELMNVQQAFRNINSRGLSYRSSRLVIFRSFVCEI